MSEWIYNGRVYDALPEDMYGFIYLITYIGEDTKEYPKGSIYVGKKAFTHSKKTKLSKKAKLLPENKGKRIVRGKKDSGWKEYYGSSLELKKFILQVGKDKFTREILKFTKTKARSTYEELKAQIDYKVLEIPSFNRWVGGKVWKHQLKD